MGNYTGMSDNHIDQMMKELQEQKANNAFELEDHDLAGFSIAGTRQPNGSIRISGSDRIIQAWPQEITLWGDTFCLETVVKGGRGYENADYC